MASLSPIDDLLRLCADRLSPAGLVPLEDIRTAITLKRQNPLPLHRLAAICRERGHLDLWRQATAIALAMPHNAFEHVYYRGNAKLLLEDWSGWMDREVRVYDPTTGYLASEYVRNIRYTTIEWDGREAITNKTILVLADGDVGDCIQMLRYIPMLAERCHRVILGVRPEVASFAKHNLGHLASITFLGIECGPFQRYTWLMSLPALFGCLPPYRPMTAPRPMTRARDPRGAMEIGICWSDTLASFLSDQHWQWHSLQSWRTIADAANRMIGLDCIVSVDTAIAHLAGALGLPTLTVLHSAADARWGLAGTTPWYPSMKLIRQRTADDWSDVMSTLRASIEALQLTRAT